MKKGGIRVTDKYRLYEHLSQAMIVISSDLQCLYLNNEAKWLLKNRENVSGLSFDDFILGTGFSDNRQQLIKLVSVTFHSQQKKSLTIKANNGEFSTINCTPIESEVVLVEMGVNAQLSHWRDIFKVIVEESEDMIFYKGKDLTYEYVNKTYSKFYNLPQDQLLACSDVDLVNRGLLSPVLHYQCLQSDEETLKKGYFSGIEVCEDRYFHAVKRKISDGVFCVAHDITKDIRLQQETERDLITGLYNEKSLARVIKSMSKGKEYHVLVIYLENLGAVNKDKGVSFSRQCMKQIAHFVKTYSDVLFFYIEGIGFIGLFDKVLRRPDDFYSQFIEELNNQHVPAELKISVTLKFIQEDSTFFDFLHESSC